VGLIYGPSGCGKSSLVKAGLLPRLSSNVVVVYVEAAAGQSEQQLLTSLERQLQSYRLERAQRARMFIACEPRRSGLSLVGSRLLGLIGCNDVSRHDAVVSVRAGFDGKELSALWSARRAWKLQERANGVFSHCFVACRAGGDSAVGRGEEW